MRQHLLLSFALIFLSSCTSVPNYSKSWATSNCQSIGYFTADTNQYSNCVFNNVSNEYFCTYDDDGSYSGTLKDGKAHGDGIRKWKDGQRFEGVFKNGSKWCGVEQKGNTFWVYKNGSYTQGEAGVDWETVGAVALIAGAAYALSEYEGGGGSSSPSTYSNPSTCTFTHNFKQYTIANPNYGACPLYHTYQEPLMCYSTYTKPRCSIGKAGGDTCISVYDTCHVGRGTACNENVRSYP